MMECCIFQINMEMKKKVMASSSYGERQEKKKDKAEKVCGL